jgi:hypothetical protein
MTTIPQTLAGAAVKFVFWPRLVDAVTHKYNRMDDSMWADVDWIPDEVLRIWIPSVKGIHEREGWKFASINLDDKDTKVFLLCHDGTRKMLSASVASWRASKRNEYATYLLSYLLSIESLGADLGGWGTKYPEAKRRADEILGRYFPIPPPPQGKRTRKVTPMTSGSPNVIEIEALFRHLLKGNERKVTPMTSGSPNVIESKLDRLIDDMRFLRAQVIGFDKHLTGIEVYLKPSEQPESQSRPWFAAAVRAGARTVLALVAVGATTGAVLHYLGT